MEKERQILISFGAAALLGLLAGVAAPKLFHMGDGSYAGFFSLYSFGKFAQLPDSDFTQLFWYLLVKRLRLICFLWMSSYTPFGFFAHLLLLFWIFFAAILLLLAIFPEISYELCRIFGIMSPSNLVFLVIIFLLVEKIFTLSIVVSQLEDKIGVLSAEVALRSKAENKKIEKIDEKENMLEQEELEKQEIQSEIGMGEGR